LSKKVSNPPDHSVTNGQEKDILAYASARRPARQELPARLISAILSRKKQNSFAVRCAGPPTGGYFYIDITQLAAFSNAGKVRICSSSFDFLQINFGITSFYPR